MFSHLWIVHFKSDPLKHIYYVLIETFLLKSRMLLISFVLFFFFTATHALPHDAKGFLLLVGEKHKFFCLLYSMSFEAVSS